MNYQASNSESLSETPERLSENKTRSGSAAKKRAVEVLTSCTNLTARSVASLVPRPLYAHVYGPGYEARLWQNCYICAGISRK